MTKHIKALKYSYLFSLVVCLMFVGVWKYGFAITDRYDTPAGLGAPGGLPPCVTAHGDSSSTADALVITIPKDFRPSFLQFIPNYNSTSGATEGGEWIWIQGMTDNLDSFGHINGSTAENHNNGSYFDFDATAATVTIAAGAQVNSGAYIFRACQ
jgi:hypothetical protein